MDFTLDDTHIALQRMAGDFVRQEIAPLADAIDRTKKPEERFPAELLERGSRLGLRTLAVPEERGGGGADLLTLCFVGEELGGGDLGIAVTFVQDWCVAHTLNNICGESQFRSFCAGFVAEHAAHLARVEISAALSPENRMPYADPAGQVPASAIRQGEDWILDGYAPHVMNGAAARFMLLTLDAPPEDGRQGFLLDAPSSGIRQVRHYDSMGMRACQDVALAFEKIRISEEKKISCDRDAWRRSNHAYYVLPSAAVLGTARRAHEHAVAHARDRIQGGKPIIEHQTVGFMLCENLMEMIAARRALQAAAWRAGQGDPNIQESILARIFASEASERIARRSMEIWGGAGYMTEAPMERLVRDVVAFLHTSETVHAMRARAMRTI
ncbi:MAG: acyl-CoA/acyl-ACP dehydrogenase [bacterium]|nr:acyl-CoA/acyl-ACP dehydrogenase [bacterium]